MAGSFEQLKGIAITYFTVKSDLKALDQVLDRFNQIEQDLIPKKDWLQCQLALAEGFTNAVRHAHKNLSTDVPIKIGLICCEGSMEIRIWDYGPPFDLEVYIKTISERKNNLSVGGRGIPILQKIADRLSYFRTDDNRNCLLIVKNFAPVKQNLTDE